jgi:hypothetical protein
MVAENLSLEPPNISDSIGSPHPKRGVERVRRRQSARRWFATIRRAARRVVTTYDLV